MKKIDPSAEKFTLVIGGLTERDRCNPYLLRSLVHEERIKNINQRLSLPTSSSIMRSQVFHPALKGHDVKTIDVMENMNVYDHHFLRRIHDKLGNCRDLNRGRVLPGKSKLLDVGQLKPPPLQASRQCKEINLQDVSRPPSMSFRNKWSTNQRHYQVDFKRSRKPFT